ncbi:dihydroxy-acid dehydratase [Rhodobacter sphaeroides]|jgi:dihydroxy-acid dehydratase|uniref:Dihydroxy-acid dehydratase n=1 Tax=Cereibacter sphaeroides (strain ATCC 17023 / DSM 158 / JCM 6121 / CCUG 31486 / LMG 2827 / NBRC 12203 / NCIMB 8253 / ATH 2.4.1.) TaxID=272943 RepID=Q3J1I5_CERS4|nr:IlvD/Edd family dehydratase [Cereibacter sphaeroides]ABA79349.1 dihydroxy-acid dehydratase [Cereibacter sphaeroides 2.4.1]AMJ47647.1 dihydroxy-acid dehydratase [Cereibacter sphaeroides]ANS34359.1 dihydroxy-acid dehydratase [Cereibacter sphaeroides]ATN63403.1 dihydroxy-acid dehydratase [Cereibacter sphaeroides]AXC61564.1 dihydroxy-acid dehydratase [Cereibacter sphaeroides 2.4.1]
MSDTPTGRRFRSQAWFDNPDNPGMTALYVERYQNQGFTRRELQGDRPIIGIAQSGSDLAPCNKIHLFLAERVKAGIRDAGGVPMEFPVHPIQETGRRPTAALDRNLAYLGLVEVLHGYPIDGVVLTTGCDKTTPAQLMAAATVDLPSIVLSGGPMLDGWWEGKLAGSGTIIWESRRLLAEGEIDYPEFMERACASAPSLGHCNTMGTASTLNALAEALGMSLPGCSAIPAPFRERMNMAYATGRRIVEMVLADLKPSDILTRQAFENAIRVNSAIGGSTNAPPHLQAIARHAGVELAVEDWQTVGFDLPLLVNMQPAGEYLGESFFRAGGVPAVMGELLAAGLLHAEALTVTGESIGHNLAGERSRDRRVIRSVEDPLREKAGFLVLRGNLFDSALMKTSVISAEFRHRFLAQPGREGIHEARAVVFEGPEDYHARINDPDLGIDETTILFIRGVGCVGYPGSAEVVNMQPPDGLLREGVTHLPTVGDGRQSGTSESPSILNASPEAAVGGGLALLRTGDRVRLDLNACRLDALVDEAEWEARRAAWTPPVLHHQTPWQEIYRRLVGQLADGGCLELATAYHRVARDLPRDNH